MIVVLGSCVVDMIFSAPVLPTLGRTVLANSVEVYPGGKGLNQAFAAARSGAVVSMLGCVGEDEQGLMLLRALAAEGISVDHVVTVPASSGVSVPIVLPSGDNGIMFYGGANNALTEGDVAAARSAIVEADVLLLQLELPVSTAIAAASIARKSGTVVVLNSAPAVAVPRELLASTTVLIANQVETDELLGCGNGTSPAMLRDVFGVPFAVVTRGEAGVSWASQDEEGTIPAWPVHAVDTVGAGDTFAGAFAAEFAAGHRLSDAVRYATAASALCVTRRGASQATPLRADVEVFLGERSVLS